MSDPVPAGPMSVRSALPPGTRSSRTQPRGVPGAGGCPPADDDPPLPGRDRRVPYRRLRPVPNAALAGIPHRFGYPIRQLGTAGAWLVAGNRGPGTGAGR